jgi:mRNA degradation ribonuclease J1/J2
MLSHNGVVSVCLKNQKGSIKLHDLVCVGIFEESEQEEATDVRDNIAAEIKLSLSNTARDRSDVNKIKNQTEKLVRSVFMDVRGKKPVVIVHVTD